MRNLPVRRRRIFVVKRKRKDCPSNLDGRVKIRIQGKIIFD